MESGLPAPIHSGGGGLLAVGGATTPSSDCPDLPPCHHRPPGGHHLGKNPQGSPKRPPGPSLRLRAAEETKPHRPAPFLSRESKRRGNELVAKGRTDALRIRRVREGQKSGVERCAERARAEASPGDKGGRPPLLLPHGR